MARSQRPFARGVGLVLGTACLAVLSAPARADRSVALILDASGSMNARLADGTVRIDAARQAVDRFVTNLADDVRLSFRAYGHGSPRSAKNCEDTELLVDFGATGDVRTSVLARSRALKAQGYTPITYVIGLAATDLLRESTGERIAVLVSDGLETCKGDPCATARALKAADARLVVHTVGFGVDDATRFQLRCIARATGGTYFGAENADELSRVLDQASETMVIAVEEEEGAGWLEVKGAELTGHKVFNAETDERVAALSNSQPKVELPAGIYNVAFGSMLWKSVEVRKGETTVLTPGFLEVRNADVTGHNILSWETGEKVGAISSFKPRATLVPATFDVTFAQMTWPSVRVIAGETAVLNAGVIEVAGADIVGHAVLRAGRKVGTISSVKNRLTLPPGGYEVEIGGKRVPVELGEGQKVRLERQR